MRVKLKRIESKNQRAAVHCGKETTETLITTEHTEKKIINISVLISASVVEIVTSDPQNTLNLTLMPGGGARAVRPHITHSARRSATPAGVECA